MVIIIVLVGYWVLTNKLGYNLPSPSVNEQSTNTLPTTGNISGWVRITDKARLYSVEVPSDWKITHEGLFVTEGQTLTRPSWVGGESPDWRTEGRDQIDASGHITSGAAIEIYVFNEDIGHAPSHIPMSNKFMSSRDFIVDGVAGKLEIYKENDPPYHEEAFVVEARVTHGGNFFTFRIAYNPTTYPNGEKVFTQMLRSFRFAK